MRPIAHTIAVFVTLSFSQSALANVLGDPTSVAFADYKSCVRKAADGMNHSPRAIDEVIHSAESNCSVDRNMFIRSIRNSYYPDGQSELNERARQALVMEKANRRLLAQRLQYDREQNASR